MIRIHAAMMIVLALASCTKSAKQPVERRQSVQPARGDVTYKPAEKNGEQTSGMQEASLPIVLQEEVLRHYVDTTKLSFKITYLEFSLAGDIVFTDGKADIKISKLPVGRSGDLTLEILEAGTVKFKGTANALLMQPGENKVTLKLAAVGGATGGGVVVSGGTTGGSSAGGESTGGGSTGGGSPGSANPNGLSFSKDIKPIMDQHCAECHHTGARSPDLSKFPFGSEDQADVVSRVIRATSGSTPSMPPAPRSKLTSTEVEKISKWKTDGLNP